MRAFARRWTQAIRAALYGSAESANPKLLRVETVDATTLRLTFDRKLKIEAWDGKPGAKALGFSFRDGGATLTDADITATAVNGAEVTVALAKPISPAALLYYGSGADGQGKPTLRDATTGLPVLMIFGAPVEKQ